MIALILGTLLALTALAYVLAPLFMDPPARPTIVSHSSGELVQRMCPNCGPRPEGDATYCSSCGRLLSGPCPQCGTVIDQPGARFCAECGINVAE